MDGFVGEFLESYVYMGVFLTLILCGFGLPIPEEVLLILGGFLVYDQVAKYPHMVVVCFTGVMVGDILIFAVGHHIGNNLIQHPFVAKWISEKNRDRVWAYFQKYGNKTIFFGRFLFGIRTPLYFTAGSIRMSFWNFLKMDAAAALISVPIMVFLGSYFGLHIDRMVIFFERWDKSVFVAVLLLLIALFFFIRSRRKS